MNTYKYQAVDPKGRIQQGKIVAENQAAANQQLFAKELSPITIESLGKSTDPPSGSARKSYRRINVQDLILYTKQLVTMVRVGIPITQALEILQEQTDHPRFRKISAVIHDDVQEGISLSDAMAKHPKVFSPLYCTIVAAGEKSGTLPAAMDRLLYLVEHEAMVKAEVKSATRYPMMVVGALVVAFVIMLGFVIPTFANYFDSAGLDLPLPTRICLHMSAFLTSHGLLLAILAVAAFIGMRLLARLPAVRLQIDTMLLRLPIIGPVLIKSAMTRFASVFAILHSSGIMILESLQILAQSMGNAAIAVQFERLRDSLEEGQGISAPLRAARYFPPLLISMVAIGEETGRLDEMLRNVSDHYDMELRLTMKKLTDSIGPVLIVLLIMVIGFFALAIYLPMWDLTQMAM